MPLIDLDFVQFYEGPAKADLAKDHRWRCLMIFPSSVARDILLRLLDPAADGVDNSATTI